MAKNSILPKGDLRPIAQNDPGTVIYAVDNLARVYCINRGYRQFKTQTTVQWFFEMGATILDNLQLTPLGQVFYNDFQTKFREFINRDANAGQGVTRQ